ncbi:hypothetical protein [Neorhizobium sp. DAR64861/K0K2]|uniref:hypothetical protein n=2 Tax=Neorhizobium TaxID=1525371 RepID=UPI003D27B08D
MSQVAPISQLSAKPVWSFNSDGSVFDLAAPTPAVICFVEMGRTMSGIRRFNGRGMSDAQHCAMGAQAILNEGGTFMEAALYLLHDGHEYLFGDIIRPLEDLLSRVLPGLPVREAIRLIKERWDDAIYTAASLPPPSLWTQRQRKIVKSMDDRMCRFEAISLFGQAAGNQFPLSEKPKTTGSLKIWGCAAAEEKFAEMAHRLIGADIIARQAAVAISTRKSLS